MEGRLIRIRKPGKITDGLWHLGCGNSGIYVLEGSVSSIIISAGKSYIIPEVLKQLEAYHVDVNKIDKLLILHSHFDHVGVVPFFMRYLPGISVYASSRAIRNLKNRKVIKMINTLNREDARARGLLDELAVCDWEWGDGFGAIEVRDGDRISLGDTAIRVLETPGHSQCSISAYVPRLKALFPSDGGGVPFRNTIIVYGTSDYSEFQNSLLKLSELEVCFLCVDHYGYVVGEEAGQFLGRAVGLAAKLRAVIEDAYRRLGNAEKVVDELIAAYSEENADGIVSGDLFRATWQSIVRNVTVSMH